MFFFLLNQRPPRSTRTDTLFPHTTLYRSMAAQFGDAVEQRLARLHIGDDRRARPVLQHRGGIDLQKLVAPDYPALAVDRADPIAVSIESDAEIEIPLRDPFLDIGQIRLFGRSEERRGGKEGVSTCRSRWAPVH